MTRYEEAMNKVHTMVNSLCYSPAYTVSKFDTSDEPTGDTRVDFEIERVEKFSGKEYITHQTGTVYVTPTGKIYYISIMGKHKPVKSIGLIVSGFY